MMETLCALARVTALFFLVSCYSSFAADTAKPVVHEVDMGKGCKIRLTDPYGGQAGGSATSMIGYPIGGYTAPLPIKLKTTPPEILGIEFRCISSDDKYIFSGGQIKFDSTERKWSLDLSDILNSNDDDKQWHYRWLQMNYQIIQLKTPNVQGYAIIDRTATMYGTIPDENNIKDQRKGSIMLSYCLLHPPKAICGSGLMGYKQDGAKNDLTPYALKILQSIEFVDDAPETPEPVPPAPAP